MTLDQRAATRLAVGAAIARLDALGTESLFSGDSGTSRGGVIYHRHDGHYGLIIPPG